MEEVKSQNNREVEKSVAKESCEANGIDAAPIASPQNQITDKHLGKSVDKSTQTQQFSEVDGSKLLSPAEIYQMQMVLTGLLAREQRRLDHRLSRAQARESPTKVTNLVNNPDTNPHIEQHWAHFD